MKGASDDATSELATRLDMNFGSESLGRDRDWKFVGRSEGSLSPTRDDASTQDSMLVVEAFYAAHRHDRAITEARRHQGVF